MSARPDDGTTQRRSIRPARVFADGREPACLVVLQGQRLGQRIDVGDSPLVIGRATECEFQILERSVSRQHSKIWREPSGYRVKDLDSTNKTFLNDQPIGDYTYPFAIFENPPTLQADGTFALPQGPGLGVATRQDYVERT